MSRRRKFVKVDQRMEGNMSKKVATKLGLIAAVVTVLVGSLGAPQIEGAVYGDTCEECWWVRVPDPLGGPHSWQSTCLELDDNYGYLWCVPEYWGCWVDNECFQ